jgi:phage FluMu protein gp41
MQSILAFRSTVLNYIGLLYKLISLNIPNLNLQTHLTFGKEFTQAVELKQVAQQDAERARFLVEKVSILDSTQVTNKMYFQTAVLLLVQ